MTNIDDKNLPDSSDMFDDDLFGTTSNDIFGTSEDLFSSASNDLFNLKQETENKKQDDEENEQFEEIEIQENLNEPEISDLEKIDKKEKNKKKKKQPKEKKKSKAKRALILCSIFLILILGFGGACGFLYYRKISVKLQTPTINIEKVSDEKIILEASQVANAVGYEFVVSIDDAKPIILKSEKNRKELDLTSFKKIEAKVRCLGKIGKAHSNYSEEELETNKIKLQMSTVFVNGLTEIKENEKVVSYKTSKDLYSDDNITWEAVSNAKEYRIYYGVDIEKSEVKFKTTQKCVYNLSEILKENGAGLYNISVVAIPENSDYYMASEPSDMKVIEYYTQQESIIFADLKENNVLTIYTDLLFNANQFSLSFNYGIINGVVEHKLVVEDLIKEELLYGGKLSLKFTVNITEFLKNDLESLSIIVLGDGKYSTNSSRYII